MDVTPALKRRPRRASRVRPWLALLVFAVAFAFALAHLPAQLDAVNADRQELATLAPADRPLIGAFSTDIDRTFLREAKQLIPPDATYSVVTGGDVSVSSPTTLTAVAPYAGYWLLPRVQVSDPHEADWLVSYGGDLASLRLPLRRTVVVSPGLELAEVAR